MGIRQFKFGLKEPRICSWRDDGLQHCPSGGSLDALISSVPWMVTAGAEGCPSPAMAAYSHATTHGSCSTAAPVRLWTSSPAQRPSAGRGETFHTAASSPGQPGTQEPRHATPRGFQPPTKPARGKEPLCCAGVRSQHPHGEPHRPPAPPPGRTMGSPSPAAMSPEPMCVRCTKFMGSPIMERSIRLLLFFCVGMKAVSPPCAQGPPTSSPPP